MTSLGEQRAALQDRLVNAAGVVRSEATIQSDVRMLLLDPHLGLVEDSLEVELETPVGDGKRIDVEVGCTVIEVKRSLATPAAISAAAAQLCGYVTTRAAEVDQRYVGILTDGRVWIAYHEVDGALVEATRVNSVGGEAGALALLGWLEGVLATRRTVAPTPLEIAAQLGAESSAHALDYSTLSALYSHGRDLPTVQLKRELWAKLLRGALGTQFIDSDELFLDHTLLVNSAEIIAHLVLGLPAEKLSPTTLLSGDQFSVAGIYGVVDRDFFDWVLEVPGGDGYVSALARQLSRFDWSAVEHDVLKVLYESVIPTETRKALGEYYTPDWLANRVVSEAVTDPLNQRVVDVSCGSGTFTFYAVKRFLDSADAAKLSVTEALERVSSHVLGIDLHPVAVALARVTYLLAIGRHRLTAARGALSVPIYLGDSLGWDERNDLLTIDYVVIPTEPDGELYAGELRFPDHLLKDAKNFDELVTALIEESERAVGKPTKALSAGTVRRLNIVADDLPVLNANFVRLKELHAQGRNHIWGYYIRNVTRPAWLSREDNRADVLVGNPPWLSYRYMTPTMQKKFKRLAVERGFWSDETTATHQDLAGIFVARAVERYLKTGGSLAFVVPNSVLDRDYWAGFRRGTFDGANVDFAVSWDLRRVRPHLFPRGSGVIFGRRSLTAKRMPRTALIWTGRAPHRHSSLATAVLLEQHLGELSIVSGDDETSSYAKCFSQGATLVPRLAWRVEDAPTGLGVPAGTRKVQSRRSAMEKKPWKDLDALTGAVESEFVWPTLLGEQVLPFHVRTPETFVVPLTQKGVLLKGDNPKIDAYPGLAAWMRAAEHIWESHKRSKMTLAERIDHMRGLTNQVPVTQTRVVYAKAGMHLAAAVVIDHRPIIDHKLYWGSVGSQTEAHYLVGVLNAPITTELAQPLMSYGKDERDIDKTVWKLPIPKFDPDNEAHTEIAALAQKLADEIAAQTFSTDNFVTMRREVRAHIATSGPGQKLDSLVAEMLGAPRDDAKPNGID
ncbi:type I restriction-modification system methyltransferase subunit [Mycobacteroides abscessus subsp. abscessus]|uniref:N-6 DNA methylase n=1 Tax=Mycobacteroides abscessus TaxID=36809 RepID=UPI0009A5DAB3|nr:N-6 DNA methylase [Mycobacteroides abscessus]SLE75883.1 type I restriction-modification system methyltransferase subunit [Mycobacteroides abscessus subsp. abscessus]SLF22987.1 type I restriction-modification system methyltransferase subunit [Mycobacteroides abscessus subsp. abscessus]SLF82239.1 type I restriction-modification system methyltransferase subunit [Mycobacteroides abscessus subsp. abscessus]SLG67428.1 type I restriction-modification system methyltransferase subunit [Mycobacteroide